MPQTYETYVVKLSDPAIEELMEIRGYIDAQGSPIAAARFADRLVATILTLSEHPNRGRPVGRSVRELTIVTPYVIRYRVRGPEVEVIRIRHGARL